MTDSAREGGRFTDAVGVLTSWNAGVVTITRKSGETVRIPELRLVAGKTVPAAPARRRGPAATFPELSRVAARAWQPVESEALGEWTLRAAVQEEAGRRTGFTRRANSALPSGDPGMPVAGALERVREWYAARGLPAYVQTATGAEGTQELLGAELERLGWRREVTAELRTAALAPLADREPGPAEVRLAAAPDEAWLRFSRPSAAGDPAVRHVLASGPRVWFASVAGTGGVPVAVGRVVVDGRWAGFTSVEVGPGQRRRGLGTAVMAALARRALDEGASAAWLQVESDNEGARALYEGMGFAVHHHYHHYRQAEA